MSTELTATPPPKVVHKRRFNWEPAIYMGPITFIVAVFIFTPLVMVFLFGFLRVGTYGDIIYQFTLEHYRNIFGGGYSLIYLKSFYLALQTNVLCILLGYPIAYYIARYGGRRKALLIFLIIIPSWTAYLIRLYAFKTILGTTGVVNTFLLEFGLTTLPVKFLYTPTIVAIGLVYTWLPFMILPLHAALEGMSPSLWEAAYDLGATPARTFFRVILPLTKGGLLAGSILVFIPSLGDWLVPHILGGNRVMMIGNLVAQKFTVEGNIPAGSSLAIMVAATLLLILYLVIKWGGRESLEKVL